MALTERSRAALYNGLHAIIEDEEAIGEVVSYFPARDVEEPATKEQVRAESAGVRTEVAKLRGDMDTGFAKLRGDMDTGLAAMRHDMDTGFAGVRADMDTGLAGVRTESAKLRGEMDTGFAGVHTEIAGVRTDMALMEKRLVVHLHEEIHRSQRWTLGLMISLFTILGVLITVN